MTNSVLPAPHHAETGDNLQLPVPTAVRWALKLFWLGVALGMIQYVYSLYALGSLPAGPMAIGATMLGLSMPLLALLFGAYLNIKVAQRKNWARIAKLIVEVASLALVMRLVPTLAELDLISAVIIPALDFIGLYLLFLTTGRLWFGPTGSPL